MQHKLIIGLETVRNICLIVCLHWLFIGCFAKFFTRQSRFLGIKLLYPFLFLSFFSANAQIDNAQFRIDYLPSEIDVCNDIYTAETSVLAKDIGQGNLEITFGLPPGVIYAAGSAVITSGPIGYTIAPVNITDLSNPVFEITNGSTWNTGDLIVFTIGRVGTCTAVDHSLNSGIFKDEIYISYDNNGVPMTDSDTDPAINPYSVNYGILSILPITPILSTLGNTETRDILVRQGGLGCLEIVEYFVVAGTDLLNYALSYNGIPLTPNSTAPNQTGTADTLFYLIDMSMAPFTAVGDGDSCFENGEEIQFEETFTLGGCDNSSSFHNANWGCNGEKCQEAVEQEGVVNASNGIPDVKVVALQRPRPELCDSVTYVVQITNEGIQTNPPGGAVAKDLAIILGLGINSTMISTPYNQTTWGGEFNMTRNWGNFKLNGFAVQDSMLINPSLPNRGPVSFIAPNSYSTDPDGPGGLDDIDGDGFYDDLQTGDTLVVSFQFWLEPVSVACGSSEFGYLGWERLYFDVSYENQCGDLLTPNRVDLNYSNIIRSNTQGTTFDGPLDVNDGDVFLMEFWPEFGGKGGSLNSPLCNGEPASASSFSSWTVTLDLPTGVSLSPTATTNPAHAGLNPSIVQIGNQVIYTIDYHVYSNFPFELQLNCPASNSIQITVTSTYECLDNAGNSCWSEDIHCMTLNLEAHCPVPCVGPRTVDFDAVRTTGGWTDPTMTTPVLLDNSDNFNLDYYYPFDTMKVTSNSVILDTALTDLYFEILYENTASGIDQIQLLRGEIEIYDESSGIVYAYPITNLPIPSTIGPNLYKLVFDLSPYNEQVSPTYLYGGDITTPGVYSRDSVRVIAYFEVAEDFTDVVQYEMTSFSGTHTTLDAQGNLIGCDTYNDRAWFEKIRTRASSTPRSLSGCSEELVTFLFCQVSASGDNFPNEYRPPYRMDSFKITIPPTMRFTGRVDIENDIQSLTNINTFRVDGNDIWVKPPTGWGDIDKVSTNWGTIDIGMIGTCQTAPTSTFDYEWHVTEFFYHPDTSLHFFRVRTNTANPITFESPTFSLQAQNPILNGVQQTASWNIDLCNTLSAVDILFNWLNIEDNPNLQITSISDITGGGNTPLTFAYTSSGIYAELGTLNRTECKTIELTAVYTDCGAQTIDVNHNWDCQSYPDSLAVDDPTCYRTETLTLNPQPSQIQLSIINQPNIINLCSPLTYELEINSAQIANIVDPYFNIILSNAPGVNVNSVNFEYPSGSGNIEPITPGMSLDTLLYDLNNHSTIAANGGINGTFTSTVPEDRIVNILVEVMTDCNFVSGSTLQFEIGGQQPCGVAAIGNQMILISDNLEIPQAANLYEAIVGINTSIDSTCSSSSSIDVQLFITGGSTTGSDTSFLYLPAGTSMDQSSYSCTSGPGIFCPTWYVTTINNQEVVVFTIPTGMNSGDIIDYSFDVIADMSIFTPGDSVIVENYSTLTQISCGASFCSAINAQTGYGSAALNVATLVPFYFNTIVNSNALCNNGSDGSITIIGSGGLPPYQYEWTTGATNQTLSGLTAGTYIVTVSDVNTCSETFSSIISEPTALMTSASAGGTIACYGDSTGTSVVSATGGTTPYSFTWSNGTTGTTVSNLSGGTHFVTITDNNNCVTIDSIIVSQPLELSTSISQSTNASCNGANDGSATSTTIGGTLPYNYQWSNGEVVSNLMNLSAGTYTLTVTDNNGCSDTTSVVIMESALLSVSTNVDANVSCIGLSDGGATVTATGGTTPYTYQWDSGQSVSTTTGLNAGTHLVTITDNNGCSVTSSILITENAAMIVNAVEVSPALCNGGNGSATTTVTGGTLPYTYQWDSGENGPLATALAAGIHTVTVTDNNGCSASSFVIITQASGLTASAAEYMPNSCNGLSDGVAIASATGGTPPYSYQWGSGQTNSTATGLSGGLNVLTVTDSNACLSVATVTISEPSLLVASTTANSNVSCNGLSDGSATVTVTGGTTPYVYQWTNGSILATTNNLNAGIHFVTITDNNGCTTINNINITAPSLVNVTPVITNTTCGSCNGAATISVSGGTMPYSYAWNNGQTGTTVSSLCVGNYTVSVMDAIGCETTRSISIQNISGPSIINVVNAPTNCSGGTGSLDINIIGGTPPIQFSIDGGLNYQPDSLFTGLSSGIYTIQVLDLNNCLTTAVDTVQSLLPPTIDSVHFVDAICGDPNGFIQIFTTGGTLPIQYSINNGGTLQPLDTFGGLGQGVYQVFVQDAAGCVSTWAADSIRQQEGPEFAFLQGVTKSNCGRADGQIKVIYNQTKGTQPFEFNINGGAWQSSDTFPNLLAGIYTLGIKDANGCDTFKYNVVLADEPGPSLTSNNIQPTCGMLNGVIHLLPTGANYEYSRNYGTPTTNPVFNNIGAGQHIFVIEDIDTGCRDTLVVNLTDIPGPDITGFSAANPTCGQQNGVISIAISSGTAPYQYSINNGALQGSNLFVGLSANTYSIIVEDGNGCLDTSQLITLVDSGAPWIDSLTVGNPSTCGIPSGSITIHASGGTGPLLYVLNGTNSITNTFSNLSSGQYTLAVFDSLGCTTDTTITLTNGPGITIDSVLIQASSCGLNNALLEILASGGQSPYEYSILGGIGFDTTNLFPALYAGTYAIVVKDDSGCLDSTVVMITDLTPNVDSISSIPSDCDVDNGSLTAYVSNGLAPYSYLWATIPVQTNTSATSLQAGAYDVTVTDDNGCTVTSTGIVADPPVQNIAESNHVVCGTPYVILGSDYVGQSFVWSTSETTNTISVNQPGEYIVTVTDFYNCLFIDTIEIIQIPFNPQISNDTTIVIGDEAFLEASGGNSYTWWPASDLSCTSCPDPIALPTDTTEYFVAIDISTGCLDTLSVIVHTVESLDETVVFPEVITPNNDGVNDAWIIENIDLFPFNRVFVVNRWGDVVFEATPYNNDWSGTHKGKLLPQGTYYYYVELDVNQVDTRRGSISLIR